jgi:hypothetical protein
MLRLILVLAVVVLVVVAGIGAALYHFFGWKGLLAAPVLLVAALFGGKFIVKALFTRLALRLFSVKSGVLKGATVTIHSVRPVNKPVEGRTEEPDTETSSTAEDAESEPGDKPAVAEEEPEKPKEYFEVDLTITPPSGAADRVWEPSELILTSEQVSNLMKMEEVDSSGSVNRVLLWNGTTFGPDDVGKYPGEQRLLVTFEVNEGTSEAWLQYYNVPLTKIQFPEWRPGAATMIEVASDVAAG